MNKFNLGDIVYVNSMLGPADECKIINIFPADSEQGTNTYTVESNEGWTYNALEDYMFLTEKDAIDVFEKSREELINKYKEEIKTVKDLITFPLVHCLCGEYANYESIEAYKIRAKELLNIEIEIT